MRHGLTFVILTLLFLHAGAQVDSAGYAPAETDTGYYEEVDYHSPSRNPIYYFGSPFADHFFEAKMLLGIYDVALGLNYTYLPEVWGGHLSILYGIEHTWITGGAEYRLAKPWSTYDWHLYGGLGVAMGRRETHSAPAIEAGIRMAAPAEDDRFSLLSGTMGVMTTGREWYFTFSISATLAIIALL